jgi:hypothetical protein
MKTVTVKELGPELPIGFLSKKSGKLIKSFSLRPHVARVARYMAMWSEANEGKSIALQVAKLLSLLVSEAGETVYPVGADGDSSPEVVIKFLDWNFADVMYVYLWARVLVCQEMTVSYGCPNTKCSLVTAEATIDLKSIEVLCVEKPDECRFKVELKQGFKLKNGKHCKWLLLKSVPFRVLMEAGASQGNVDEGISYSTMREVICDLDGGGAGYVITDPELDQLPYLDLISINRQAGRLAAGPKLRTTIKCDKCQQPIERALDWRYDHFFDSSIPVSHLMP